MRDITKSYMQTLKEKRSAVQALRDTTKPPSLHERIEKWYDDLPDDDKRRAFTMKEFKAVFGETPQRMGAALFDLGWTRKRMWRDDRPTARYWLRNSG